MRAFYVSGTTLCQTSYKHLIFTTQILRLRVIIQLGEEVPMSRFELGLFGSETDVLTVVWYWQETRSNKLIFLIL